MTAKSLFKRVKLDKNQSYLHTVNNQQVLISISDDNIVIDTIDSLIETLKQRATKYIKSSLVLDDN